MNSHVSKNDTLAGKVVTKVQQVRKFILKHRVSKKKIPDWAGICEGLGDKVTEIGRLRKTGGGTGTGRWK